MAGSANSIVARNVLRGTLNANNLMEGHIDTAFNPTYALVDEAGNQITLYIDSSNYQFYAELKDKNGNHINSSNIIDLPLESMVVNGSYDATTKEVVLVLNNGNEVRFSVADLVEGLVSTEQLTTILSDYVQFIDYATAVKAGVVKISDTYATAAASGVLTSQTKTYEQYNSLSNDAFIGKGTLENVIAGKELTNKTYVDAADEVFENDLFGDKTANDNGENIILDNTTQAPMKIELKGNTQQNGTPTPDTPIPVQVVSGDNTIKVEGKNLFDIGTSNSDYDNLNNTAPSYLTVSGNTLSMVIQGGGSTRFYRKQNLEGNNTFTINSTTSVNEARYFVRIRKLDDSGWMTNSDYTFTSGWSYNQYFNGWYINVRGGNNDETFTIPECLYWQIGFGWDTNVFAGTTQTMSNIQLEYGSTASTTYIPYQTPTTYPINLGNIELCKIGDYQDSIKKSTGKNLFDKSSATQGYYYNASLVYTSSPNAQTSDYIKVNSGSDYTISYTKKDTTTTVIRINYFNGNKEIQQQITDTSTTIEYRTYTFTIPNNIEYVRFSTTTNQSYIDQNTIQLEKGSATTYEPYGTNWYLHKEIGNKLYRGEESEQWEPYTTHMFRSQPITEIRNCLSNLYIFNSTEFMGQLSNGQFGIANASNQYALCVRDDRFDTATELKEWLNTHYLSIYYPLNKPTYETITDTTLLSQLNALEKANSYDEQTNISQVNDDMPFELAATAFVDSTAGKLAAASTQINTLNEIDNTKEDKSNKVATISASSTDTEYPTAKCMYDIIGDVESLLEALDIGSGV